MHLTVDDAGNARSAGHWQRCCVYRPAASHQGYDGQKGTDSCDRLAGDGPGAFADSGTVAGGVDYSAVKLAKLLLGGGLELRLVDGQPVVAQRAEDRLGGVHGKPLLLPLLVQPLGRHGRRRLAEAAGYAEFAGFLDVPALIMLLDSSHAFLHFPSEESFGLECSLDISK